MSRPYLHPVLRILFIRAPIRGIVDDVFVDAIQFVFVVDDTFVVIALPNGRALRVSNRIDASRRHRFEITDDHT